MSRQQATASSKVLHKHSS